eukprot:TRINITY_DN5164_c3_g1_i1.p1 TRINITY_DN5164_c3_g1~~TRINITY_DN5164_c3_g1_i1.p1  ORF type:complete len:335 (+),score=28.04 TRINITY_DN5164_c3_g1_i1:76-1080(+)
MILVGVGLEVFATLCGTVGKQLLRYSKMSEEDNKATLVSKTSLVIGLSLNILAGPILEVLAYGQAPQTLLAPLMGLDVLWNILLVPHTLGENPDRTQVVGCLLLVFGTALTAVGGPHQETPYSLQRMRDKILTHDALTYIAVEIVLLIAGCLYMNRQKEGCRKRGLVLGLVAGGIGGNLFCMKAAASLIQATYKESWSTLVESWVNPLPIVVVLSAVCIGASSAILLTKGMREYEASMMVATYEGAFVISGCASGVAILGELDVVSPQRRTIYALGVALVICGVASAQGKAPLVSPLTSPVPANKTQCIESMDNANVNGNGDHHVPLLKASAFV